MDVKPREIAEAQGYHALLIEAHENKALPLLLLPPLRRTLFALDRLQNVSQKVKRGLCVLCSFIGAVKVKVGEAAADRGTAVAIIVDDLQYTTALEMSALIMAIHQVSQRNLPLVLIGAGLPQLVGLAGKSKSYAERLFTYPEVGALSFEDATSALQGPVATQGVGFTPDALAEVYRVTQGYPYFLQEWG